MNNIKINTDILGTDHLRLLRDTLSYGVLKSEIRQCLFNLIKDSDECKVGGELLVLSNMYLLVEELRCLLEERVR